MTRSVIPVSRAAVGVALVPLAVALFCSVFVAAIIGGAIVRSVALDLPSGSSAEAYAICGGAIVVGTGLGWCGVRLLRLWRAPLLVVDDAGIHAPFSKRSVAWNDIERVSIDKWADPVELRLTPGNSRAGNRWQRLGRATSFDLSFAKARHAEIIDAIRSHPNYRGQ